LEKRDMSNFDYLKTNKKVINVAEEIEKRKPTNNINVAGMGNTKKVFDELAKKNAAVDEDKKEKVPSTFHQKKANLPYNAAHYTTGEAAESFTSTAMSAHTQSTRALIDEDDFMYKRIKSKSYARIITNYGNINVELFSDKVYKRQLDLCNIMLNICNRYHVLVIISFNLQKLVIITMCFFIEI
jgi:peptidyl-prolyl cis-trans isomerase-like protein 2